jgi:hypothetical protein
MAIRNFKNKGTEDINYGRASKEANPSQGVASESQIITRPFGSCHIDARFTRNTWESV